ncbi:MAG: shikimate dehydrogenase [Chitinivibrionales bacterium]
MAISGASRLIGLLGNPVGHSISPQIHNHASARLNLPYVYIPLAVRPDNVHSALFALRALGFAGANVTIPYKQTVLRYCDVLSDLSRITGTCNTLYFKDNLLHGTTTDAIGFLRAVKEMGSPVTGESIAILGNGGTARTLAAALLYEKLPDRLVLVGRSAEKVGALADALNNSVASGKKAEWTTFDAPSLAGRLRECSLIVNCTPVGMYPHTTHSPLPPEFLHEGMAVFDTIYNPVETKLLQYARTRGCKAQNGLRMLLYQALDSYRYWTGKTVPDTLYSIDELQRLVTGA